MRHRLTLLIAVGWLSWLAMMLVHEAGHAAAAVITGGRVERVVWHPLAMSRTDVSPNPRPLPVLWAGPVVGCVVPLAVAAATHFTWRRAAYVFWFVAGFCLIANGSYIGLGLFDPVGDAKQLLRLGTPPWLLGLFGLLTLPAGFYLWHRVSPAFGFGPRPKAIDPRHASAILFVAAVVTLAGLAFGQRG